MRQKKTKFSIVEDLTHADGTRLDEKTLAEIANVEEEFIDIQNYQRKQKNNLLGVFKGKEYVISDEMISRLLEIPKKFDRFEGNSMYATSTLGSFIFNFRMDLDIGTDFCKGELFFIEIECKISGDSKIVTKLDEVLDIYDPEFRSRLDKNWHIYYGGESPKNDDFLEKYMKMQLDEVFFCRELEDVLSQLYVTRMLALLSKLGEKGEKIEKEYREIAKKFAEKDPDFANKHELHKRILDEAIEHADALDDIAKTEDGRKILKAYSSPMKNVRDKTYPSILTEDVGTKKKEPETKRQSGAKSGGKSKSSGGGGKKSGGKPYIPPKLKVAPLVLSTGGLAITVSGSKSKGGAKGSPAKPEPIKVVAPIVEEKTPKAEPPKEPTKAEPAEVPPVEEPSAVNDESTDFFEIVNKAKGLDSDETNYTETVREITEENNTNVDFYEKSVDK